MPRYITSVSVADLYTFAIEADDEDQAMLVADGLCLDHSSHYEGAYKEEMDNEIMQLLEIPYDEVLDVITVKAKDVL